MNHQQIVEIANVNNRLQAIRDLNNRFLEHAKLHPAPNDIPTRLEFKEQAIAVDCFGYCAEASPRFVTTNDWSFAVEYLFLVAQGEVKHEVWRFYLTSNGQITEDLNSENTVCDFNNTYVAKHVCGHALLGVLHSPLFSPSPTQCG